jgi:hypothetical protein
MRLCILLILLIGSTHCSGKSLTYSLPPEKKNGVKLNLSRLLFSGTGSLQYERALGPHLSVAAEVGFMPSRPISVGNGFLDFLSGGGGFLTSGLDFSLNGGGGHTPQTSYKLRDVKGSAFSITPEFRFYPLKTFRGFYFAPCLRVRNLGLQARGVWDDTIQIRELNPTGQLFSLGFGFMGGLHYDIGRRISIDCFLAGIQYSMLSLRMKGTLPGTPLTSQQQILLSNDIREEGSPGWLPQMNVSTEGNTIHIQSSFGRIGFRGLGLNFGYRF